MADDAYVRVYYSIRSDERFADIYGDDHRLATWLRLLLDADATWPAPASIPLHCRKAHLDALTAAGIIEILSNSHFRVHGLDAERERRSMAGKVGGIASARARAVQRPSNGRPTTAQPTSNLDETSIDEHRRDETSIDDAREADDGRLDLEAWLMVRHRIPTPRQRDFLDAYCRTFDVTGPQRAEQIILRHPDDPIAALKLDLDAFRAERIEAAKLVEHEPKPKRHEGLKGINAELAAMLREQYGETT